MQQLIICILIGIAITLADPVPSGGANCTSARDCGQIGGTCDYAVINGTALMQCTCYPGYAMSDCSYVRKSKTIAGGLQVGLSIPGIFGTGNIYLGYTARGVGQLVLGLCCWVVFCVGMCIAGCCAVGGISGIKGAEGGAACAYVCGICMFCGCVLSGFIWSVVDGAAMLEGRYTDPSGFFLA